MTTKTIAVINHKGGVGKTTSALNIAGGLAKKGNKTLLIDLDPQADLTVALGCSDQNDNLYETLINGKSFVYEKIEEDLDLVTSSLKLADAEIELFSQMAREQKLQKALNRKNGYDYIIIDCPPSLNQLTINALVAADYILIPLVAEYFSLKALNSIVKIVEAIQNNFNSNLKVLGMFINDYDKRQVLSRGVKDAVEDQFEGALLETTIRGNIALSESVTPPNSTHIFKYAPSSNGAKDYGNLVEELLKRLN